VSKHILPPIGDVIGGKFISATNAMQKRCLAQVRGAHFSPQKKDFFNASN
jgi:hypothetical protein